jgi:hypothetical protein
VKSWARSKLLRHLLMLAVPLIACSGDGDGPSDTGPEILAIGPNAAPLLAGPLFLTVQGTGFVDSSIIEWNGQARETEVQSTTRLGTRIDISDLRVAGAVTVQVVNPDGARSEKVTFLIAADAVPFGMDSTNPHNDTEANPGTTVTVYLSEAIDSSSVSDTSLTLSDENGPVAGTLAYENDTRALVLSTTLEPVHRYSAHVSDELRSISKGALASPAEWSFTTTLGVSLVLDSLAVLPSLVLGTNERPSVAARGVPTSGSARLGIHSCTGDCSNRQGWSFTGVDPAADSGPYTGLATDASGGFHLAWQVGSTEGAVYGRKTGEVTVLESGGAAFPAIAATPAGRLHMAYYFAGDLHAASCSSMCTSEGQWALSTVDTDGNAGSFPSIAVDPQGGVHVTYFVSDSGDLRYAVCPAPCTVPNWTSGGIATAGRTGIGSSLIAGSNGMVQATWIDETRGEVMYGHCTASCTDGTNWSMVGVDRITMGLPDYGFNYTSLALGPDGRLDLSYFDIDKGWLRGATCATMCELAGSWSLFTVSLRAGTSGLSATSLKVDVSQRRHVAWTDADGRLRYTRY